MAKNEILQIVVFRFSLASLPLQLGSAVSLDRYRRWCCSYYVESHGVRNEFCSCRGICCGIRRCRKSGLGVLQTPRGVHGRVLLFYLRTVVDPHFIGYLFLGKRITPLLRELRMPTLLAFSTASSEAAFPKLWKAWSVLGVKNRIASFVLPLGIPSISTAR